MSRVGSRQSGWWPRLAGVEGPVGIGPQRLPCFPLMRESKRFCHWVRRLQYLAFEEVMLSNGISARASGALNDLAQRTPTAWLASRR